MARTQTGKTSNTPSTAPVQARPALGEWVFLKFGRSGAKLIHRLSAVALRTAVLFFDYLLVLFTAVNVLPNVAALVQQGTGVSVDMRIDVVLAGWLIPVIFIAAAILVGEVFVMGRLWRFASRLSRKIERALLRDEPKNTGAASHTKGPVSNRRAKIAAVS